MACSQDLFEFLNDGSMVGPDRVLLPRMEDFHPLHCVYVDTLLDFNGRNRRVHLSVMPRCPAPYSYQIFPVYFRKLFQQLNQYLAEINLVWEVTVPAVV